VELVDQRVDRGRGFPCDALDVCRGVLALLQGTTRAGASRESERFLLKLLVERMEGVAQGVATGGRESGHSTL
jgi:hypothetical protein